MSGIAQMARPLHPALDDAEGQPVDALEATDRRRLAVLLEAGSLLAHLTHAGWWLADGWRSAVIEKGGQLRCVAVSPGPSEELPQVRLKQLMAILFRTAAGVAGRGQARRAARRLQQAWAQELAPLSADEAVRQLLIEADFLWRPEFADSRAALAAEHAREDGSRHWLWLAGPAWFREPLLAQFDTLKDLRQGLREDSLRRLWSGGSPVVEPLELARQRRWRAAAAAWREVPPQGTAERLECAKTRIALGQYEQALASLERLRNSQARALRVWCLGRLGRVGATRAALRKLESATLDGDDLFMAAESAVRMYGNVGEPDKASAWIERLRRPADVGAGYRADLLAATAAWDRQDPVAMRRHLEAARPLLEDPRMAWRWHHVRGLLAMQSGDGAQMVQSLSWALKDHRRSLTPAVAAGLWNELAIGRALQGDLAGAERAFRHTLRLYSEADGPRVTTLALFNLAEIRLRRGLLPGVHEILERTTAEDRDTGNWRAQAHDAALWARYELVLGRPNAALARLSEAVGELARRELDWHRSELSVLTARALGWTGRGDEARAELATASEQALSELEEEERPALFALAGDRERALQVATGPLAPLWVALLTGEPAATQDWSCLDAIEPYRAARFVFDIELVAPGSAPAHRLRRAIATFRRLGAHRLAERLEASEQGAWDALGRYLRDGVCDPEAVAKLLRGAGYPEARLVWTHGEGETVVVPGVGGGEEITASTADGRLTLSMPQADAALEVLFGVVRRDLRPGVAAPSERRPVVGGIVGESEALLQALERVDRLAPSGLPVLVTGETGTGKELIAKRLHAGSDRAQGAFVPVNCAALSDSLLLSELFGHVRGAFTGADRDRAGVFEAALGGTVFLDEVGDLPLEAQGSLLRVLQQGEVRRLGESLPRRVDVRVVAATNHDLEALVESGGFRSDLYYRLRVGSVELPPLRERGHDIELLARYFLRRVAPARRLRLADEARTLLLGYDWPGNVRELENVLAVAAAFAAGEIIEPGHLDLGRRREGARQGYHEQVEGFRRRLIEEALEASGGRQAEAARRLGISRQALSYLVRKLLR